MTHIIISEGVGEKSNSTFASISFFGYLYFFKVISCQDTPQNEIENYINDNIIKEYFKRYK